jgi:type II secretory pathway pseudopilin PulG
MMAARMFPAWVIRNNLLTGQRFGNKAVAVVVSKCIGPTHTMNPLPASRPRRQTARAFTLTDLLAVLVVVAIFAFLSSLALAKSKDKALSARCLANLQQCGLATALYANDHNSHLPYAYALTWRGVNIFGAGYTATNWLNYLGVSPADYPRFSTCPATRLVTQGADRPSFTANRNIPWFPASPAPYALTKLTDSTVPAQTCLMMDAAAWITFQTPNSFSYVVDGTGYYPPLSPHGGNSIGYYSSPSFVNGLKCFTNGFGITVYFDGHADMRKPDITGTSSNTIPLLRPAAGQRLNWNPFWTGTTNA